ncbi:thiamine phosphate synthase [Sulfitobacter sp. PR48]|jgi:thiamine-phosphate pyrophosphorylase|uniref:Thiamine phosphate synthase n=1 Tax=Sulfitobacter porphyrae TaxID=1246864 RepID=A0ABW2B2B0_9RHOB|nr:MULTISPECIES: thiamine phosphate synthase [unclassified Sulfitobacter]MCZ4254965.1 thiamine phosphate synthase [Sulfitobacter sp. G21635-S1]MDD9721705.1 thiamine phosphate synthase [Sulfitobacter sp. PR48]GLT10354.1 thiamine phosphate synthase [Sulfitobacter porphyrae]
MDTPEQPQIYLITPPEIELGSFPALLGSVLDAHPVACVRLALSSKNEDRVARAADALREVTHARDVALVISDHLLMVERLGLDGVHLSDAARSVRYARKELGEDAIVGSYCGPSKHDGMAAGEAGADYVSFGPAQASALGDGSHAETELFQWWSEVIEVPVVAEGALDAEMIRTLAPYTDFFGIGDEIWSTEDPAATLATLIRAMV